MVCFSVNSDHSPSHLYQITERRRENNTCTLSKWKVILWSHYYVNSVICNKWIAHLVFIEIDNKPTLKATKHDRNTAGSFVIACSWKVKEIQTTIHAAYHQVDLTYTRTQFIHGVFITESIESEIRYMPADSNSALWSIDKGNGWSLGR